MVLENANFRNVFIYTTAIILIFLLFNNTKSNGSTAQLEPPSGQKLLMAVIRPQIDSSKVSDIFGPNMIQEDYSHLFNSLSKLSTANSLPAQNKGISFFSLADIKANIQAVKNAGLKFVMFDIERSADFGTPWDEIADGTNHDTINPQKVVNTFKEASRIVREAGLQFWSDAGFPFNRWDYKGFDYLTAFAPYVDGVKLQGMSKLQGTNGAQNYKDFIVESINRYKAANPNINTFFAQVTTNPEYADLQKMKDGTNAVLPYVTGMSSWYSDNPSELSQLKSWVEWYHTDARAVNNPMFNGAGTNGPLDNLGATVSLSTSPEGAIVGPDSGNKLTQQSSGSSETDYQGTESHSLRTLESSVVPYPVNDYITQPSSLPSSTGIDGLEGTNVEGLGGVVAQETGAPTEGVIYPQQLVPSPFTPPLTMPPSNTDTIPPETGITSAIDGSNDSSIQYGGTVPPLGLITLTLAGTDNIAIAGYVCSIDSLPANECSSPVTIDNSIPASPGISGSDGTTQHSLQVNSIDTSGNIDQTPAVFSWVERNTMSPQTTTLPDPFLPQQALPAESLPPQTTTLPDPFLPQQALPAESLPPQTTTLPDPFLPQQALPAESLPPQTTTLPDPFLPQQALPAESLPPQTTTLPDIAGFGIT